MPMNETTYINIVNNSGKLLYIYPIHC